MQTFRRLVSRASAFAFPVSIVGLLAACSGSESDSSKSTASTSTSSGGSPSSSGSSGGAASSGSSTSPGGSTNSGGAAASGTGGATQGSGGGAGMANGGGAGTGADCSVNVASHELDDGIHVTECSQIDYSTNPPSSGQHYPLWAAYQTYDFPVPRGYWVHALEHGAIVISYDCPDGCPDEVAQVEAIIESLPSDPRCPVGLDHQVIITPDPLLDTRWAMSSWGHTLRADCIDEAAFEDFYESNVAHGPEDICGGGAVLTEEDLAPDCGE